MQTLGISYGIAATFLWACFPAFCKITLEYMSAYQFLLFRYIIAFGLLSFMMKSVFKKRTHISKKLWASIFILVSAHNVTQALCLREIPVSWYILFFSCSPILTYFISPFEKKFGMYLVFLVAIIGRVDIHFNKIREAAT